MSAIRNRGLSPVLSTRGGNASRGALDLKWILVVVLAVAIIVAVILIPRVGQKDQIQVIADLLKVKRQRVTVNIPPSPSRYPGAVLLAIQGDRVLYSPGQENDPDLQPPEGPYPLVAEYSMDGSATGSMELSFFKEAVSHREMVDVSFSCDDAITVEMSVLKLREHLAKLGFVSPGGDGTKDRHVIYRALKGKVKYAFKKRVEVSGEAWTKFEGDMEKAVNGLPDLELRLEGNRIESNTFLVQFKTPIVFAFLATEIDEVLVAKPGSQPSPAPAAVPSGDARPVITAMLDFGPARIPALSQAVSELGPKASALLVDDMLPPDPERRDRAALMLKYAPPPPGAAGASELEDLKSTSVPVRAWAVARLEARGTQVFPALVQSLKDPSPAVRHLAISAIGAQGTEAGDTTPALERALDDSDSGIRLRASGALLRVNPSSTKASKVLESGLLSTDARERRGAAIYFGPARLKELSEHGEPKLKEAAFKAMRETPDGVRRL